MPRVPFESLPDSARVWVFGGEHPITDVAAERFLERIDAYLERWAAHGTPLHSGRDWREHRFLTIAVDQSRAGASGCSIDGLFRIMRDAEDEIGTTLLGGGRVYYRAADGSVASATRDLFATLGSTGVIGATTTVFDPTVQTLGEWRERFETVLSRSWHAQLMPDPEERAEPMQA